MNRAEDIFSYCSISFTTLRMSHAKNFAGDKRQAKSVSGNQALGTIFSREKPLDMDRHMFVLGSHNQVD